MYILAAVFLLTFLSGCAISQSDIEGAGAFCETNGGVNYIKSKYNSTVHVGCNNTAQFTFKGDK